MLLDLMNVSGERETTDMKSAQIRRRCFFPTPNFLSVFWCKKRKLVLQGLGMTFFKCRRRRRRGLKGFGDRPKGSRRLLDTWWRARLCKLNPEINRWQCHHLGTMLIILMVMVMVIVIIMVIIKVVINRWLDDVTGFVSIVVERVEGVFLVLRPESAVNEEAAVRVSPV